MSIDKITAPSDGTPFNAPDPFQALRLSNTSLTVQYIAVFVMVAIATVVAVGVDHEVTIPNLSLIYVVPVVAAAVVFGLGPSLFSAVLGALAYNFFLTEPRYSLAVDDPANIWAIALLFVVGCIASAVASTARRRADDVSLLRRQAAVLQACSRDIVATEDMREIVSVAATALEALFHTSVVIGLASETTVDFVERRGKVELGEVETEAAQSSLTTRQFVPADVYPFDASRFDFWPVATSLGPPAVIGLAFDPQGRPPRPGALVEVVGGLLGLALDRQRFRTSDDLRTAR